jgi:nucleotide-binding universal stress UspA family protein
MKKICIALDTTPSAQKIAELGYAYAKALNAEVTLVHVVNDMTYYNMNYDPIMGYSGFLTTNTFELVEGIKNEAEKFLLSSVKHLDGATIKTAVLEGEPASAILEFANNWNADLIVMGTHSRSGLANFLMGSIAVDIVKQSKIPTLIIPTKEK